jgi:hypothetical protein
MINTIELEVYSYRIISSDICIFRFIRAHINNVRDMRVGRTTESVTPKYTKNPIFHITISQQPQHNKL